MSESMRAGGNSLAKIAFAVDKGRVEFCSASSSSVVAKMPGACAEMESHTESV